VNKHDLEAWFWYGWAGFCITSVVLDPHDKIGVLFGCIGTGMCIALARANERRSK